MTVAHENNLDARVREKLLQKLAGVMKLKDEGGTLGEIEAAAIAATHLLFKLGLSEEAARAEIEARGETVKPNKIVCDSVAWIDDARTTWEIALAAAVAKACMVMNILEPQHVTFVGTETDTAAAAYMWAQLAYRLEAMSQEATTGYAREYKRATGKSAYKTLGQAALKKYRRNWLAGAVDGIAVRVNENLASTTRADQNTHALVVRKDKAIVEALPQLFPKLKWRTWRQVSSFDKARNDGFKAGYDMKVAPGLPMADRTLLLEG